MSDENFLSSIEEVIEDAKQGKLIILIDDEGRENEGDLVIPAQMVTPETINFMAMHGRGLICLAMTAARVDQLGLRMMSEENRSRHQTAFTISIEAREGVSTGISAYDRAHTIQVAIDPDKGAADIGSPGHVFPLVAQDGGVLRRAGHTEAAVDIARLAGLDSAGVVCEIMNDDGTMARLPDLVKFAQFHGLKIATIADLIAYRRRFDNLVERSLESELESRFGGKFQLIVYRNLVEFAEHIALVKGDVSTPEPVMVRMHALNVLTDVLGDRDGQTGLLESAMEMIGEVGRGVVVLIREPRPNSLSDRVRRKLGQPPEHPEQLRDYGIGAQILLDLGIKDMILLSNTARTIIGRQGFGLTVVEQRPIPVPYANSDDPTP